MRRIGKAVAGMGLVAVTASGMALASVSAPPAAPAFKEPQKLLWKDGVKNAYPRWSKDGKRILYQSNRSGKWQIYVMNADLSNEVQLTKGEANNNFPDWSPDNSQIAFVSDRGGNEDVYVMRADGSGDEEPVQCPGG